VGKKKNVGVGLAEGRGGFGGQTKNSLGGLKKRRTTLAMGGTGGEKSVPHEPMLGGKLKGEKTKTGRDVNKRANCKRIITALGLCNSTPGTLEKPGPSSNGRSARLFRSAEGVDLY